jgi:hypothetical protein
VSSALDTLIESYTSTTGAYWPLSDNSGSSTAVDASGNGHPLTSLNEFTFGEPGLVPSDSETSLLLGTTAYGGSGYSPSYAAVTFGFIAKVPSLPSSVCYCIQNTNYTTGMTFVLNASNQWNLGMYNGVTFVSPTIATAITAGHVYLVVGTWNGTTVNLYAFDITSQTTLTPVSSALSGSFASPNPIFVGSGGGTFAGYLARAFVLPQALSSSQVTALYNTALSSGSNQGAMLDLL